MSRTFHTSGYVTNLLYLPYTLIIQPQKEIEMQQYVSLLANFSQADPRQYILMLESYSYGVQFEL